MLESGMMEEQKGQISVVDSEPSILRQLLQYLYTGKVDKDFTDYKELMVLANKYGLVELVEFTSHKVLESINEDNALELGIFGDIHNSAILLNASAQFIYENANEKVLPEGWEKEMKKYPGLMLAIIVAARKDGGKVVTEFDDYYYDYHQL